MNSCVQLLERFITKNKVTIYEGKLITSNQYRANVYKLLELIVTIVYIYVLKQLPRCPVTIIGSTIYAKLVTSLVAKYGIEYRYCRNNARLIYYQFEDTKLPLEGVTQIPGQDVMVIIPHTSQELKELETHTHLNDLQTTQERILSLFKESNGVYLETKPLALAIDTKIYNILDIKKLANNLYYIITTTECWLTQVIFSDNVDPLQTGEIIRGVTCELINHDLINYQSQYQLSFLGQKPIVSGPKSTNILSIHDIYQMNPDWILNKLIDGNLEISTIYGLKNPRPFDGNTVHPFHLPVSYDPFLSIMIVVTKLLELIIDIPYKR